MPASGDLLPLSVTCGARQAPASPRAAQAGFTLLEIMVTVMLLGIVILPILQIREDATNRAIRSKYMLLALHHAQELIATHGREVEQIDAFEGRFEELPEFRYELTLQDWDLATGRPEDEEDQDPFANDFGAIAPSDAEAADEEMRSDPHRVRRFSVKVYFPDSKKEDEEEHVALEGFLPRVWEENSDLLGNNNP